MMSRSYYQLFSSLFGAGTKFLSLTINQRTLSTRSISIRKCFPLEMFDEKSKETIGKVYRSATSRWMLLEIGKNINKAMKNEVKCQECGSPVRYLSSDTDDAVRNIEILIHACGHSTKKPFVCRKCQHESATKQDMGRHVTRMHKVRSPVSGVHYDECWNECFDEVKASLTKCFVGSNSDPSFITKIQTPSSSELSILRRLIYSNVLNSVNIDKKIRCQQCQKDLCVQETRAVEEHIYSHLRRQIYECAMCGYSSRYASWMRRHLTDKHDDAPFHGNHINRSDEYHEEILVWLKKCFGKE